ncbi:unnamed protein product [Polarella glacialis]|uniref:Subtilisin n=1 Tax=Polarella glacialis TaxID=89957 RepID=A0A813GAY7_POLGL|nr:unnamed protein product [Polarella glacialis]
MRVLYLAFALLQGPVSAVNCTSGQFEHAGQCESLPAAYSKQVAMNCDTYDSSNTTLKTLAAAADACDRHSSCVGINDAYCNGMYNQADFYSLCLLGTNYANSSSCVFGKPCPTGQFEHAGKCEFLPAAYSKLPAVNCDKYDASNETLRTLAAAADACDRDGSCVGINDAYCNGMYDSTDFYSLCLVGTNYTNSSSCVFRKPCPAGQFDHAGRCESLPAAYSKQEAVYCDASDGSNTTLRTLAAAADACDRHSSCVGINDAYCNGMYGSEDFYSLCLVGTNYTNSSSCVFGNSRIFAKPCPAGQFDHAGHCESLPAAYSKLKAVNCDTLDGSNTTLRTLAAAADACDRHSSCVGINDAYCNGMYGSEDFYSLCLVGTNYTNSSSCVFGNSRSFAKPCPAGQFDHAGHCESLPAAYSKQEAASCDTYDASNTTLRTLAAAAGACDRHSSCVGINDAYCNGMYGSADFYSLCLVGTSYTNSSSCVFMRSTSGSTGSNWESITATSTASVLGTTATTTSLPVARVTTPGTVVIATVVEGSFTLTVGNCQAFVARDAAQVAVRNGLANATGLGSSYVQTKMSCATRRLAERRGAMSEMVSVSYTVTIPSGDQGVTAASFTNVMNAGLLTVLTSAIQTALTIAGITDVVVIVEDISVPKVVFIVGDISVPKVTGGSDSISGTIASPGALARSAALVAALAMWQ